MEPGMQTCAFLGSSVTAAYLIVLVFSTSILLSCKLVHALLRYLYLPQIVSILLVATAMSTQVVNAYRETGYYHTMELFVRFVFAVYMFVLGLEMDIMSVLRRPTPAGIIAYAGMFSSMIVTPLAFFFFRPFVEGIGIRNMAAFDVVMAATASPVIARLTTELKVNKFEFGRLAINAGITTDMVSTFVMAVGIAFFPDNSGDAIISFSNPFLRVIAVVGFVAVELAAVRIVGSYVFEWLSERNPEGKPMMGPDLICAIAMVVGLCAAAQCLGYDASMNAFLVGLMLPRDGRMSRFLISNLNFMFDSFILPVYLCTIVVAGQLIDEKMDYKEAFSGAIVTWAMTTIGRLLGTIGAGMLHGLQLPESIAVGLLLNIKGGYHIFAVYQGMLRGLIRGHVLIGSMLLVVLTIVFKPALLILTRDRAGKQANLRLMGLQWHNPANDLRLVIGLHGAHNLPMAINLVEGLRWGIGTGTMTVYAVDMVELTTRTGAMLVPGEDSDDVVLTDEATAETREQVRSALNAYTAESGEGINVQQMLALSNFGDMHLDICGAATDNMAVLIVLPFHKRQRVDGSMDDGQQGFRQVNIKVLQYSACSVAIMVDRGFGRSTGVSASNATQSVAVVFIGGADDREALALAGRIAQHPGVRMTAIRFMPDAGATTQATAVGHRLLASVTEEEMQMKADDEYFAGFYERHIANKAVGYVEKVVKNGAETVATLRALEAQYQLFIVGRGRERHCVLTAGMAEWAECPELGPIGDVLAASDFSTTCSVLVIQQHDNSRDFDVIDEEFLPILT